MKKAVLVAVWCLPGTAWAQPTIESFAPPAGTAPFLVNALSANGRYVCGKAGPRAFRWNTQAGLEVLEPLLNSPGTRGNAVADDGTVVGVYEYPDGGMGQTWQSSHAVSWSPTGVLTYLPTPVFPWFGPNLRQARGVSSAGTLVVGSATNPNPPIVYEQPVIWSPSYQFLPVLPGDVSGLATAVSGDGSVVVGFTRALGSWEMRHGFRWTPAGGIVALPALQGQQTTSPTAVSYDGSVIVGSSGDFAVRWDGGAVAQLAALPGVPGAAAATAISGDIIVGNIGAVAAIWTSSGVSTMSDFLSAQGLNLAGWQLTQVCGISRDGRTLAGLGTLNGVARGWVVTRPGCYPNCDASTLAPILNVNDFICFQQRFAAGESSANCDASTSPPVLNIVDFVCFAQRFAAGCQ